MQNRNKKVVKMKRKRNRFLGFFLLIFSAYILILFFQSVTKEHVSIYEVNGKQIADNENLRGIILRDEKVINSDKKGYVNYYVGEGSKLAKTTTVYSVSENEKLSELVSSVDTTSVKISDDDTRNIRGSISEFRNNFSISDYQKISNFKYNISNTILELSGVNLSKNLKSIKNEIGKEANLAFVKAKSTGIVSFSTDGLENLSIDDINYGNFSEMTDNFKQLRTNEMIDANKPIYRVVTSEQWSIVVNLKKEQYVKLLEKDTVAVRIKKDNMELTPSVNAFTADGKYYANLTFDKYMIHYLNNRYLDIEIQFNSATGLKIPKSSIISKNCYVIPCKFLCEDEETGDMGISKKTYSSDGKPLPQFIKTEVYYKDVDGNIYIDANVVDPGTVLLSNEEVSEEMTVSEIKKIDGVYNCNVGYCRFKYIEKLYENKEYAIVKSGNLYSIAIYDHIVLNPKTIKENDIIY